MWLGHFLHAPARQVGRDYEELTRHDSEWQLTRVVRMAVYAPVAAIASPLGYAATTLSWMRADSRIEVLDLAAEEPKVRTFKLFSLNVCFQDAHASAFAAGVVAPFEPCNGFQTRVEAVVDFVTKENPDIFCGQEFTDIASQSAFVEGMISKGFRFFIIDRAPHTLFNNSGLLIASKYKLTEISFIEFPMSSRHGGCKWVQKGAIRCQIAGLTIINTHLNGWARQPEQVRDYIMPHFTAPALLIGDLNFETKDPVKKAEAGLQDYTNIFEEQITWTNQGVITRRTPDAAEWNMSIDVMIATKNVILTEPVVLANNEEITDHYGITAYATI